MLHFVLKALSCLQSKLQLGLFTAENSGLSKFFPPCPSCHFWHKVFARAWSQLCMRSFPNQGPPFPAFSSCPLKDLAVPLSKQ